MAASSTSLREKGNVLLSRATADQEKEPRGGKTETSPARPGRFFPPLVPGEWLSGSVDPAGQTGRGMCPQQFPVSSCQVMVTLMAPDLIFGDDK